METRSQRKLRKQQEAANTVNPNSVKKRTNGKKQKNVKFNKNVSRIGGKKQVIKNRRKEIRARTPTTDEDDRDSARIDSNDFYDSQDSRYETPSEEGTFIFIYSDFTFFI